MRTNAERMVYIQVDYELFAMPDGSKVRIDTVLARCQSTIDLFRDAALFDFTRKQWEDIFVTVKNAYTALIGAKRRKNNVTIIITGEME